MYVYVLALEKNRFYVGLCLKRDPFKRIKTHYKSNGARYTQINKVLKLICVQQVEDTLHELITTLKYMKKYGINNVRGDKYIRENISDFERHEIANLLINLDTSFKVILSNTNVVVIKDDVDFDPRKHKLEINFPAESLKIIVVLRCIETFGLNMVENDIYKSPDATSVCTHLRHSNQQCIKCGSCEHFAKSCSNSTFELDNSLFIDKSPTCGQSFIRFCRNISPKIKISNLASSHKIFLSKSYAGHLGEEDATSCDAKTECTRDD